LRTRNGDPSRDEPFLSEGEHTGRAYGLSFSTEFPIGYFPDVLNLDKPDVRIRRGKITANGYTPPASMQIEASPARLLLRGSKCATFLVTGGDSIIVEPLPGGDPAPIRQILLGWALGGILHQRGMVPLHGSAICQGDDCYVFCAASGVGKSTLTAAFLNRGFSFLDDNIAVAAFQDGIPCISPGTPELRLWEGAIPSCTFAHRVAGRIRPDMAKMSLIAARQFRHEIARLRKIFILKRTESAALSVEAVTGVAKFRLLLAHIFFFDYIKACGISARQFRLVQELSDSVPMAEIRLPDPLPSPATLCEAIIRSEMAP
jgi:hypothetical protein